MSHVLAALRPERQAEVEVQGLEVAGRFVVGRWKDELSDHMQCIRAARRRRLFDEYLRLLERGGGSVKIWNPDVAGLPESGGDARHVTIMVDMAKRHRGEG